VPKRSLIGGSEIGVSFSGGTNAMVTCTCAFGVFGYELPSVVGRPGVMFASVRYWIGSDVFGSETYAPATSCSVPLFCCPPQLGPPWSVDQLMSIRWRPPGGFGSVYVPVGLAG